MAKIIEISGPAGAGKTTIIKSILKNKTENFNCVLHKDLFPRQKMNFFKISTLTENLPFYIRFGKTHLDQKALVEAGMRFVKQNPDYINVLWENIIYKQRQDINGNDKRFSRAAFYYDLIQKYQYIKELNTDKYVLFDEGLIHFLPVTGSPENKTFEEDVKDIEVLLQAMPLPDAFIYIDTDADIIIQRLQQRNKVAGIHKKKDVQEIKKITEKCQERMVFAKDTLISLGVPVLELDSKQEVPQNSKKIKHFLNQLDARPSLAETNP